MEVYVAVEDIAEFHKGDEVPADRAKVWIQMYAIPPVRLKGEFSSSDLNKDGSVDQKDVDIAEKKVKDAQYVQKSVKSEAKKKKGFF